MSVQEFSSDALAPQYDSTGILVDRLSNWKYTVEYLITYFQNYLNLQKQTTQNLEKLRKGLNDPPRFLAPRGGAEKPTKKEREAEAAAPAIPPQAGTFEAAFQALQHKTDSVGAQSESATQSIKTNILPTLQACLKDIETQYKQLKSSNKQLSKSIDKSRDNTEKLIERLGKYAVSQTQIDAADDPFVLKRRIKQAIGEQVQAENESAEQGLGLQNNFLAFEEHLVGVIQNAMLNMQHVIESFCTAQVSSQVQIAESFGAIDKAHEWSEFLSHNKEKLVPHSGYQRAVDNISFANEDHASTIPLMAGHLTRTTTVLRKLQTSYYAVTRAGYLQEFKSEDVNTDLTPTLSLYLPHSVLGTLPPPSCTDYTFKINSKNSNKKLTRGHSYVFRASSYDELGEWYYAIARKCAREPDQPGPSTGAAAGGINSPTADNYSDEFEDAEDSDRGASPLAGGAAGGAAGTGSNNPFNNPHAGPASGPGATTATDAGVAGAGSTGTATRPAVVSFASPGAGASPVAPASAHVDQLAGGVNELNTAVPSHITNAVPVAGTAAVHSPSSPLASAGETILPVDAERKAL